MGVPLSLYESTVEGRILRDKDPRSRRLAPLEGSAGKSVQH